MAAPSPKCISLLFLLLFSLSAEARVSEFFSKAARFDTADPTKTTTTTTTTTPAKVEDDPNAFPFTSESGGAGNGNGYGLYGHSTQDTNPSAGAGGEYFRTDAPAQEFHVGNYEGKGSSHAKEYRDVETKQPEEVEFDNNQFAAKYPDEKEEYESREPTTRVDPATADSYYETTFENRPRREEEPGAGKERAREYDNVEATKEYEEGRSGRRSNTPERYGMSDTRTLENGRYFYDLKNDNYRGNPYTATTTNPSYRNDGYYGAGGENKNEYQDDGYKQGEYQNPQDDPNGYMP